MGALHAGHLSLVEKAKAENDRVYVSIFVNPTQFNNQSDLKNYPRTPEADIQLLTNAGVDFLFAPTVEEMYDKGLDHGKEIDLGDLEKVMEGEHRPGHFKGVVQVVSRLFDIVKPTTAYFGEKDFQQLAVIRKMTADLNYNIIIKGCPTKRESNGLAMSSRNLRLSEEERETAANIYKALCFVRDNWRTIGQEEAIRIGIEMINSHEPLKVEYLQIADAKDLQPVSDTQSDKEVRIFTAVFCGPVRLIDNIEG
jgi:pantoate--beta-alanine ligase